MSDAYLDQICYLPVKVRHVSDVTSLVARLFARDAGMEEPAQLGVPEIEPLSNPQKSYNLRELQALENGLERAKVALALLDLTAAKPGELVSFPEACRKAGLTEAQGRSHIGTLTKIAKKLGKDYWPITWHWATGGEKVAYYQMPPEIAKLWRQVRTIDEKKEQE